MAYIYESWQTAGEVWTRSSVYLNVTSQSGTVRRGVKRWMTQNELARQYGESVAAAIVDYKLSSTELAETEVRWHPDCPGNEAGTNMPTSSMIISLSLRVLTIHSWNDMCRMPDSSG